jgi:hypothetical protein
MMFCIRQSSVYENRNAAALGSRLSSTTMYMSAPSVDGVGDTAIVNRQERAPLHQQGEA